MSTQTTTLGTSLTCKSESQAENVSGLRELTLFHVVLSYPRTTPKRETTSASLNQCLTARRLCSPTQLALLTPAPLSFISLQVTLCPFSHRIDPNVIGVVLDAYDSYTQATGATSDETTGLLRIEPSQYSSLSDLTFTIGDVSMVFLYHTSVDSSSYSSGNIHLHPKCPDLASVGECHETSLKRAANP